MKIEDLIGDDYENICADLNVKNTGRDYKTLAGKMGFTVKEWKKLELNDNPTDVLLSLWGTKSRNTVNKLIQILEAMENDQVADQLRKVLGKISNEQ